MIHYFNRKTKKIEVEKVYGDWMINLSYENPLGLLLTDRLFSKKWASKLIGWHKTQPSSTKAIPKFIKDYAIDMSEYVSKTYTSFNDFFIRKFKPGVRNFSPDQNIFSAGCEARYLAVQNISDDTYFPVKRIHVNLAELLGSASMAKTFIGGTCIIARLCPVDYHRFHFPVSGEFTSFQIFHGVLHSVNPKALKAKPKALFQNERHVSIFQTAEWGKVAMIEVGALGVGKIVQSFGPPSSETSVKFDKGAEKGYFLFGGSTVIWVLEPGAIKLDQDLALNSSQGMETWIPLGDRLGER